MRIWSTNFRPRPLNCPYSPGSLPQENHAKASSKRTEGRWPVRCVECGAELPGEESCKDPFYALLATEWEQPETVDMHALFVLAYHA